MKTDSEKSYEDFCFEITTTQACNFKCEYCFENDCEVPDDNVVTTRIDEVMQVMKKLFSDQWFKDTFASKKITYWGGEPCLNMNVINKVTHEFKDEARFFVFTNGSKMNELLPLLKDHTFDAQISYDGEPISSLRRLTKSGKSSTEIAVDAMQLLKDNDVSFSLKSTIGYKDMKHLPEVWDSFYDLNEKYGVRYAVTVDYHNIEFHEYKDEVEDAILQIAKKEYNFFKDNSYFLSNIFSGSKKFCTCGRAIVTIDIDGKAYYCHGCLYSEFSDKFCFGSIFDEDFIDKIKHNYQYFYKNKPVIDECEKCPAMTCLRCNVTKYEQSTKDDFYDKWHDYSSQKELCEYYQLVGKVGRAMINLLKEE